MKPKVDLTKNARQRKSGGLDDIFESTNVSVNNDNYVVNDASVNENNDVSESDDSSTITDNDVSVFNDVNVYTNNSATTTENKTANNNVNISANIIVIKKAEMVEEPERTTYYLKPSTHKKLQKLAKESKKGISEFLQELLDGILDNVEIK